jgi:cobalt/nickel transport system permease protein
VSVLFLRSHDRGERVYLAMLSRGFTGSVPALRTQVFGRADVAFLAIGAVTLIPLRIALGVAA